MNISFARGIALFGIALEGTSTACFIYFEPGLATWDRLLLNSLVALLPYFICAWSFQEPKRYTPIDPGKRWGLVVVFTHGILQCFGVLFMAVLDESSDEPQKHEHRDLDYDQLPVFCCCTWPIQYIGALFCLFLWLTERYRDMQRERIDHDSETDSTSEPLDD